MVALLLLCLGAGGSLAVSTTQGICSALLSQPGGFAGQLSHLHSSKKMSLVHHTLAIFISLEMLCVAR